MIAIELAFLQFLAPFALFACAVAMVVLRASGSRVFFDVVGTFQATRMLNDAGATATVLEALYLDSLMGIQEAGADLANMFNFVDEVMPLTVEIENARVEFEKFVDNIDDAKILEDQIQAIGLSFGFAADEAFTAGARMAQLSGVLGGQGSTAVGTEMGMMFGAISGMGTEAAMQRLINLNQQTKFMTKNIEEGMSAQEKSNVIRRDTIRVLDQLNTVENRSAATMQQITFVMNQFASQAHLTNESIAAMAAMSATLIEAGEEQGKGGRALRMIYARLGADTNGARTFIEKLGIAVVDTNGDMRPFSDLLQDLAVHYNTLNGEQKMQMAQQIAGNRHYTRLIKLLENVDRVRELELEALLAQFPARDELQRRLDSEVFAYEQAEASLKNYSAAVGNALLPSMTAVIEQQALFNKTLASFLEGRLGGVLGGFIMMSKLMSNFIGPTAQAIISITNLRVALQTQNLVARALRGEQIAGNLEKNKGATLTEVEIYVITEKVTALEAERIAIITKNEAISRERVALQGTNQAQGHRTRKLKEGVIALRENTAALDGYNYDLKENEIAMQGASSSQALLTNEQLKGSMSTMMLSIQLGGLGSAFMMFGKNEKHMRMGMILTTAAMALQMVQVYRSMAAMAAKSKGEFTNLAVMEAHTWGTLGATKATQGFSYATLGAAKSMWVLDKSIKVVAAKTGILLAALVALDWIFEKLGFFEMPDMSDIGDIDGMAGQIADTGLVIEYMVMETEALTDILESNRDIIASIGDAQDSTSMRIVDAKRAENVAIEEVMLARRLEQLELEGMEETVNNYIDAQKRLNQINKEGEGNEKGAQSGFGGMGDWFYELQKGDQWWMLWDGNESLEDPNMKSDIPFSNDWLTGGLITEYQEVLKITEDFAIDFADLHAFMSERVIENHEDLMNVVHEYVDTFHNAVETDGLYGSISGSIASVTEELYEFNNAREEMFFGFSSDRLTGDLVRQVHQQGVETLITSTEVIMHNTFNGMTVPEIVEQVMQQIESEANQRNYNLATSG